MSASAASLEAARLGDVEALRVIEREYGPQDIRVDQDPADLTALHIAAAAGHENVVRYLLSEGISADASALRGNNFSPLHAAAMNGHATVSSLLLDHGADPDVQAGDGGDVG